MGKAATEELELLELDDQHGGSDDDHGTGFGFGDDSGGGAQPLPHTPPGAYVTGMVLGLAAILMFFLALTSAFVVRKGLSNDWAPVSLPPVLWLNTILLAVSSFSLERARRALRREAGTEFHRWWALTCALGVAFLAGQVVAWQQLAAAGVYLSTNPSSAFFYVLTSAHGLHLLGGVLALLYVGFRSAEAGARLERPTAVRVAGIYWHFMGALWVYLFLLLLLGQ